MAIANRLARIEQEILEVENEKLQREQTLGAFWEHMPAIDPIIIRDRMLFLQNEIRILENRKGRCSKNGRGSLWRLPSSVTHPLGMRRLEEISKAPRRFQHCSLLCLMLFYVFNVVS